MLLPAFVLLIFGTECMRASVSISPSSANLKPGSSIQFTANGAPIGVYIWNLSGAGCSGISCGEIDSTGFYTAPAAAPSPGIITVTATYLFDLTQSGTATVTMGTQGVVGVKVSPTQTTVDLGGQQLFTSAVTGTSNTGVTWTLSGVTCTGTTCGTITASGLYTAPVALPNPAIVYVKATSKADISKSATATVNLVAQIKVSVTPGSAQLRVSGTQQFTGHVTGTSVTGVSWSLSGAGCSGVTCGTITSSGFYTAPASAPNPATITVRATSQADSSESGTAIVSLVTPIGISITPTAVVVIAGGSVQFHDSVVGTTNTAVTWSLSGASCSGSACGTISTTGLYTAPATIAAQMNVTVTVKSQVSATVSASATVTILRANNSKLNGRYAFSLSGVDNNGTYLQAGSIVADGNGNILSGTEDINDTINPIADRSISGTYSISSDNRGVLTIHGPTGTQTLRIALNLNGTSGRVVSFDSSGVQASGVIYRQDPTAFDVSVFTDGYVFSLTGTNYLGQRVGALGLLFPDGSGFISGSSLDVNEGGVVPPTFATFSGIYDVDATGRGTMTLSVPGFDGGLFNFAFYVVSQKQLLIISTDPLSVMNPIFSGPGQLQSGAPFTSSSFGGGTIFSLSGAASTGGDDTVGRIQFNSGNKVQVNFDRNAAGTVTTGGLMTGAYDMQLNGRGTLNLDDADTGSVHIWLLYATAPNAAFLLDIGSGSVGVGGVTPQLSIPFSNSTLIGTYVLGSGEPVVKNTFISSGTVNYDGSAGTLGTGAVSGTEDTRQGTTVSANQPLAGKYSVSVVSNNGRGSMLLASPKSMNFAIWAAGPSSAVGLQVDATATNPTVIHIDQ
jgi:hypothetical protein